MYKISYTYSPLTTTETIAIAREKTLGFVSIKTYRFPTASSKKRIFSHINNYCLSISLPLFGGHSGPVTKNIKFIWTSK